VIFFSWHKKHFLLYAQRHKTASDRLLVTPGKAWAGRPTVIHRKKSWTYPKSRDTLQPRSTQVQEMLSSPCLALTWPKGGSTPPSGGQHRCKQSAHLPGPATGLHQVLNHQFKPWPNSSPTLLYLQDILTALTKINSSQQNQQNYMARDVELD